MSKNFTPNIWFLKIKNYSLPYKVKPLDNHEKNFIKKFHLFFIQFFFPFVKKDRTQSFTPYIGNCNVFSLIRTKFFFFQRNFARDIPLSMICIQFESEIKKKKIERYFRSCTAHYCIGMLFCTLRFHCHAIITRLSRKHRK